MIARQINSNPFSHVKKSLFFAVQCCWYDIHVPHAWYDMHTNIGLKTYILIKKK